MADRSGDIRIARNTVIVYIRILVTTLVGLVTSRFVLQALGVSDYGLYNVVGSVVSLFSFISGALTATTTRFINFEMGRPDGDCNRIFNVCHSLHLACAGILLLVIEAAGLLTPAKVNKKTGYRYYDEENISRLGTILTLQSFGFHYEDIREYFEHSNDYTRLYYKLVSKSHALVNQIEKMRRRIKTEDHYHCEILTYEPTYCLVKKVRMVPTLPPIYQTAHALLYEAINQQLPVDYTRALLIETFYDNYRDFDRNKELDLLFCVPLREKTDGPDIKFIPGSKILAYAWSYPGPEFSKLIPSIDSIFESNHLEQNGPLCATIDVTPNPKDYTTFSDIVMHFLIPIK